MEIRFDSSITEKADPRVLHITRRAQDCGLFPVVEESRCDGGSLAVRLLPKTGYRKNPGQVPEWVFQGSPGVKSIKRHTPTLVSLNIPAPGLHHKVNLGNGTWVGHGLPCHLIAGPCTVDRNIFTIVELLVKEYGILDMRGGCWKPRSGAEYFRGYEEIAAEWFFEACCKFDVASVATEVISERQLTEFLKARDQSGFQGKVIVWVGARTSSQELFSCLARRKDLVVMIMNEIHANFMGDFLNRARFVACRGWQYDANNNIIEDRCLEEGNHNLLLCVRGTQVPISDESETYNTEPRPEWVGGLQDRCWLPVGFDPSHSSGGIANVIPNLEKALPFNPSFVMPEVYLDGKIPLCDAKHALPMSHLPKVQALLAAHNAQFRV